MKRRHFLQSATSALTAIGLSQTGFLRQAHQYSRALAQNTPRKLALLVGINQYPDESVSNLYGCLTDVEMQYQLLVNRFGFNPKDIVRVSDDGDLLPTRANILQAFEEHLIQQAQPGDVVVFHYSGHGSLVTDPSPVQVAQCGVDNVAGFNGTLVPREAAFTEASSEMVVPDIMGRSLFLLTERLNTENVTLVLDSCFSGAGTRGNARVRSTTDARLAGREGITLVASSEELENQQRWLRDLGLDEATFRQRRAQGIAKGVALGSASCNQIAYELPYDEGATAGTFTYLLTSYLWQSPAIATASEVKTDLVRSTRIAAQSYGLQVPIFESDPVADNLAKPLYFLDSTGPFADAVVRSVTGDQIEVWLGGVSHANLETVRAGTVYALLNSVTRERQGELVVDSRNGLLAYGHLANGAAKVQPGMLLREQLIAIPTPTLRIGVDASLAPEREAAEMALQQVLQPIASRRLVTVLPVNQQTNLEFLLARTTTEIRSRLEPPAPTLTPPPLGSVALFSEDLTRFVPNTAGPVDESATAAINRMERQLRRLLVIRALRGLTSLASDLQVTGEIFTTSGQGPVVPLVSRGSQSSGSRPTNFTYQSGEVFQIQVKNSEPHPVYLSALVIDSAGDIIVLHPAQYDAPVDAALVDANASLTVPREQDGIRLRFVDSGYIEIVTLISRQPLRGLLQSLKAIAEAPDRSSRGPVGFDEGNPLALVSSLLSDVDNISRGSVDAEITNLDAADTAVDADAIAAFSTVIEIIP